MKEFAAALTFVLCSCVSNSPMRLDHNPLPADSDASRHYIGRATLAGTYHMEEAGDLCFLPSTPSLGKLLSVVDALDLCFSNEEQAVEMLDISSAIESIDTKIICGIEGKATVVISDLWVGDGPVTTWHTTQLASVISKQAPKSLSCGG